MTLRELQAHVDTWIGQFQEGYWPPLANLARLVEEVGELSRELNHRYGPKKKKAGEPEVDLGLELADIIFVIVAIANREGIDLQEAMARTLQKYALRDETRWLRKDGRAGPFQAARVQIPHEGGALVGLYSDPPRGDATGPASHAAVVCAHGMLSSKESDKLRRLAEHLWPMGVACLRFDFAGRGESPGDPERISYSARARELASAVAFVRGAGRGRLGLFGSSMGGAVSVLHAATDVDVHAVVALAAVSQPAARVRALPEVMRVKWRADGFILHDGARVTSEYLDDALATDVLAAARAVAARGARLLVLHGLQDTVVPPEDGVARAPEGRGELITYPDADHRFTRAADLEDALARATAFLARALGV